MKYLILLALVAIPVLSFAYDFDVAEKVALKAKEYGNDPALSVIVLLCESNLQQEIFGDHGNAYGIAQFWKSTFDAFKKEAGMPFLNYKNMDDQIELYSWALANGHSNSWTCYTKTVNPKSAKI